MKNNMNPSPDRFWEELKKHKKITVFTHTHPDPDTFCSATFLAKKLMEEGINVHLVVPNSVPYTMTSALTTSRKILGKEKIIIYQEEPEKADLLEGATASFIVDAFGPSRTEEAQSLVKGEIFAIDHHTSEPEADYYIWDSSMSSTALVIHRYLVEKGPLDISSSEEAYCMLSAILTDNGWFKYPSTNYYDLEVVKKIGEKFKISPSDIASEFLGKRIQTLKMLEISIGRLELVEVSTESKRRVILAYTYVSLPDLKKHNATWEDTESIATLISELKEADIIAIAKEQEKLLYRVSFRTRKRDIDVSKIATDLGGGGHRTSAATKITGGPAWVKHRIVQSVKKNF